MKRLFIFFFLFAVVGAVWYWQSLRSYSKWFDTHLMGTVYTPLKEREMSEIICQPFRYCAQGAGSKAYVSEDGRFIIKTFLKNKFQAKYCEYLPFVRELANKRKTLKCKYKRALGPIHAYQYILKESGMIFYQFIKPRDLFHQSIQLTEKDGSISFLDLDRDEYVIQKKAILVSEYLNMYLVSGEAEKVKNGISKLLRLTKTLYDHNLVVSALQFGDNFGFVDDEPIRIDLEHLRFDPSWEEEGKIHLKKELRRFRSWIVKRAPADIIEHFDSEVQTIF